MIVVKAGGDWEVCNYAFGRRSAAAASCPTRDAAEAARRLLSGECAQGLAEAQIDRLVAAKTGAGKPMRALGATWALRNGEVNASYDQGKADGAAQERERIVALLRAAHPWVLACGLADDIGLLGKLEE